MPKSSEKYKTNYYLKKENNLLKDKILKSDYLTLENTQLRKLIDEQMGSYSDLVSSRVMLDKQSPYLNSFIVNSGSNKNIKNGMEVLDGKNFIGRIVDVNFFSSRDLKTKLLTNKSVLIRYEYPKTVANLKAIVFLLFIKIFSASTLVFP